MTEWKSLQLGPGLFETFYDPEQETWHISRPPEPDDADTVRRPFCAKDSPLPAVLFGEGKLDTPPTCQVCSDVGFVMGFAKLLTNMAQEDETRG